MRAPHLKYVRQETTRHGKLVWYLRRPGHKRVRLPPPDSAAFSDAYRLAYQGLYSLPKRSTKPSAEVQRIERSVRGCIAGAKTRAKAKGLPFDLSLEWALRELRRQDFRCSLTGIRFHAPNSVESFRSPYSPSLDRIVPSRGYVQGNVRIVIVAVNVMLSDWGEAVFRKVANCYRRNSSPPKGAQEIRGDAT